MSEEKEQAKLKWIFIHTIIKNMILNAVTTLSYSGRMFTESPIIKEPKDIKSEGLREIYIVVIETFDEWETESVIRRQMDKGKTTLGYRLKAEVLQAINIVFTVVSNDWIYEDLVRRLYNNIGRSYNKESNEEYLNKKEFDKRNSLLTRRKQRDENK